MKVLITGGAGFLGSHLAERMLEAGNEVLVIDNYETGRRDNLSPADGLEVIEGSIVDADVVDEAFDRFRPDVVAHAAASYEDPDNWTGDVNTNALGTVNVVRAAQRSERRADRLLPDGALLRDDAARAADHARASDPPGLELRDLQDGGRAVHRAERHRLRLDAARQRLRTAQPQRPAADVLPAPDRGQAVLRRRHAPRLRLRRRRGRRRSRWRSPAPAVGHYHLSSGSDESIKDVFDAALAALEIELDEPVEVRPRGEDDAYTILLDPSRIQADFGWTPKTPLAEGAANAIAWYREHGITQTFTHLKMAER